MVHVPLPWHNKMVNGHECIFLQESNIRMMRPATEDSHTLPGRNRHHFRRLSRPHVAFTESSERRHHRETQHVLYARISTGPREGEKTKKCFIRPIARNKHLTFFYYVGDVENNRSGTRYKTSLVAIEGATVAIITVNCNNISIAV